MSEVIYEIDGKTYTEDEVISVYQFWQTHCDTEDINDAIDNTIEHSYNMVLSSFVEENSDMIREACIEHLPLWHDIQRDTLNSWDESIFDFASQLIDVIYYDSRR